MRRRAGRPSSGASASQPRAQHADGVRHAPAVHRDSRPSPTRGPRIGDAPWCFTSWRTSRGTIASRRSLAFAACALYWFHPARWWVARRLRIERELACDDRVIAAGAQAREYAGHLLEIAYTLGGQSAPALAVGMARPRQLEGRMLAALDAARNRRVPAVRCASRRGRDRGRDAAAAGERDADLLSRWRRRERSLARRGPPRRSRQDRWRSP